MFAEFPKFVSYEKFTLQKTVVVSSNSQSDPTISVVDRVLVESRIEQISVKLVGGVYGRSITIQIDISID